jgi:hypothetical protein
MHQPILEYQFQLDGDGDWTSVPVRKVLFSDNCTSDFYIQQKPQFVSHGHYGSKNLTEDNFTWREFSNEIIHLKHRKQTVICKLKPKNIKLEL